MGLQPWRNLTRINAHKPGAVLSLAKWDQAPRGGPDEIEALCERLRDFLSKS